MEIKPNNIYNIDCIEGMKMMPDGCVDLVVTDPPYEMGTHVGAGGFGRDKRDYYKGIDHLQSGISGTVLRELVRVCRKPNIYLFCSKEQLPQLLNFATANNLSFDLLAWHKKNPIPTCNNKYLSDTEYIVFMRRGASLFGTYETKRKYFITLTNKEDKKIYGHPTIKPLNIIQTLIFNSAPPTPHSVIFDPFIGSGTTAVAAIREKHKFIGFELNEKYYNIAQRRIQNELSQALLF